MRISREVASSVLAGAWTWGGVAVMGGFIWQSGLRILCYFSFSGPFSISLIEPCFVLYIEGRVLPVHPIYLPYSPKRQLREETILGDYNKPNQI